jgi:hypothetical protein
MRCELSVEKLMVGILIVSIQNKLINAKVTRSVYKCWDIYCFKIIQSIPAADKVCDLKLIPHYNIIRRNLYGIA